MKAKDAKAIIGVYDSHLSAIEALKVLKSENFDMKTVALIGKTESVKEIDGIHTWDEAITTGAGVGALAGGTLGVLAGLSLLAVPGFGVIYLGGMVGALLGGIEGTAIGGLGGGLLGTIFGARYGVDGVVFGKPDKEDFEKYQDELKSGKFLIIVHASDAEVEKAHNILTDHATHEHISSSITPF
jgi:hypothetical protein